MITRSHLQLSAYLSFFAGLMFLAVALLGGDEALYPLGGVFLVLGAVFFSEARSDGNE